MKALSISRLGMFYILASLLAGFLFVGMAVIVLDDAKVVGRIWNTFEATRSEKARNLSVIRREMGFGGMIHQYKNFILRGEREQQLIVEQRIGSARAAIERYRTLATQPTENEALATIETVLGRYRTGLEVASTLVAKRSPVKTVDEAASVNDRPAFQALESLNNIVNVNAMKESGSRKPVLIYELHSALGYGGMIHHFKNFVLRRDQNLITKIQEALRKVRDSLTEYKSLSLSSEEATALDAIGSVAAIYEKNLGLVIRMTYAGMMPRTIDKEVKVDDGPALVGMAALTRALVVENNLAAKELATAVVRIVKIVGNQLWAVGLIVAFMILFTVWVLRYRIVLPLNRLIETMRTLADGDLDANIPRVDNKTEIGRMAAAIEVFKAGEIERRTAWEEVKDRERWFRELLESTPDATIIVDADGAIQLVNKQTEKLFGYTVDELVGETVDILVPDAVRAGHAAHRAGFTNDAHTRPMGKDLELSGQSKSGEIFPVEVSLSPIPTSKGMQVAASVRDISERKAAAAEIQDAFNVISSSIDYASRIQRSVLPDASLFSSLLSDHFVIWEPRDVVGGDIYWCRLWGDGVLVILGDCTGHGVPGAFMTLISTGALDNALSDVVHGQVGVLLQRLHQLVQITLGQHGDGGQSDDGMDLGICYLNSEMDKVIFAGARFELFLVEDGTVSVIKGTKSSIGYIGIPHHQEYEEHEIINLDEKYFYMTSDGLTDQIGGKKGRMFGKKRLREVLLAVQDKTMTEQKEAICQTLKDYQGDEKRRDDVAVIGFKI